MPYFEKSEERNRGSSFVFYCYQIKELPISSKYAVISPNWHNEMELLYSEAYVSLYINDTAYDVVPGDIFFINPRMIHRAYRKSPGDILPIVFDLNLLKVTAVNNPVNDLIDDILNQKKKFITKAEQGTALYRELLPVIQKITESRMKRISFGHESCRIISCLFAVMSACCRENFFKEVREESLYSIQYVNGIMDYVDKNYQNSTTVSDLAKHMNISETYLYRLFRTYIGTTPVNYLNSVRIRESYRLLEEGKNVTETAVTVGLPNVSYFIKLFKRATGQTPHQWINRKEKSTGDNRE